MYLDKNHPPAHVGGVVKGLPYKNSKMQGVGVQVAAVIPKCLNQYSFTAENGKQDRYRYPFSLRFIMNCLSRVINRKDHETLMGSDEKILSITFLFINFFRGFNYDNLL